MPASTEGTNGYTFAEGVVCSPNDEWVYGVTGNLTLVHPVVDTQGPSDLTATSAHVSS